MFKMLPVMRFLKCGNKKKKCRESDHGSLQALIKFGHYPVEDIVLAGRCVFTWDFDSRHPSVCFCIVYNLFTSASKESV